MVQTRAAAVDA